MPGERGRAAVGRRGLVMGAAAAAGCMSLSRWAAAQPAKMHQVGVLTLGNADAESFGVELREGMREAGFGEGRDVRYEFRSAGGRLDALPIPSRCRSSNRRNAVLARADEVIE